MKNMKKLSSDRHCKNGDWNIFLVFETVPNVEINVISIIPQELVLHDLALNPSLHKLRKAINQLLFVMSNETKKRCILNPRLCPCILQLYALKNLDRRVTFEFHTSAGLYNYQKFKARTKINSQMASVLFADGYVHEAHNQVDMQTILNDFSVHVKVFGHQNFKNRTSLTAFKCIC